MKISRLPSTWSEYNVFEAPAVKEKCTGRASGGLAVFYKNCKHTSVKLLWSSNLYIVFHVKRGDFNAIVLVTYIKPDYSMTCVRIVANGT